VESVHTAQLLLHPLPSDYASPPVQQNMFHNRISILCPAIAKFFKKNYLLPCPHGKRQNIVFGRLCL